MATLPSLSAAPRDALELPADAIEVGRIVGAWGLKGGFKVLPHASDPQALFSSKRWFLQAAPGPVRASLPPLLRMSDCLNVEITDTRLVGKDWRVIATVKHEE